MDGIVEAYRESNRINLYFYVQKFKKKYFHQCNVSPSTKSI